MKKTPLLLTIFFTASFASAATSAISFDDGKNDLKALLKNIESISAIKTAPKAAPVVDQGDRAGKTGKLSISCSSAKKVTLQGKLDEKGGDLVLTDPERRLNWNSLNMNNTELPARFRFERKTRPNEAQNSSVKFFSDATYTEDIELSFPKGILSGEKTGEFTAYFTLYTDDGEEMYPEPLIKMSCSVK